MAAFCGCCGAEITLKAEACPVCGTPRHGMASRDVAFDCETENPGQSPAESPKHRFACESRMETRRSNGIAG